MKLRVLLVEDDPDLRDLGSMSLELDGFEVEPVETVAAALRSLAEGDFCCVITDLVLEGGAEQGLALCERLQRERPDTLVVAVTGDEALAATARERGADRVLLKPVDFAALAAELRERFARDRV